MNRVTAEQENWPELFNRELDTGKPWSYLPLKDIDWNSTDGKLFLKRRCQKGDGENVIGHFKILRLKDETALEVLGWILANGAPIEKMPAEVTFRGGEEKCKPLWNAVVKYNKGKEYLELLRSCREGDNEKKLKAYDYVVSEYKSKKLGVLPESKVIFGKFEEEEKDDQQRQKLREEQKLMDGQGLAEEQKQALVKRRRSLLTNHRMGLLTKELQKKGTSAVKTLWRTDALGILHHYIDADDVKDFPEFIKALTLVIENAVEKNFEETYLCVRAFPLLYGGEVRYDIPPVIEKAFKKYPTILKAIEKEFLDLLDPREQQDYFFFTKMAVTNPDFNWKTIDLGRLPEDGVILYNESDEKIFLSLREQMEEILIAAHEAGIKDSIPEEYRNYYHADKGVLPTLAVLWSWQEGRKAATQNMAAATQDNANKSSWLGRLLKKIQS
jgi:hypothetical protein